MAPSIPPLQNGDRLTIAEFERRYEAMPHVKKAELIEGIVYFDTLTTFTHGTAHADLAGWLGFYNLGTPHLITSILGSIRLDQFNELQPDVHMSLSSACGGQTRVGKDDIVEGAPEFVAEVAYSSVSIDLHEKFEIYRRNGVREYLVWRLEEGIIDWFVLRGGDFARLTPCPKAWLKSENFPGLWLDPAALIRGNLRAIYDTVKKGEETPEHEAFVVKLLNAGETR